MSEELKAYATTVENCELFRAELAAIKAQPRDITAAVDAAMIEMANISPPMRRSECERLIRAALYATPVAKPQADHVEDVRAMGAPSIEAAYAIGAKGGVVVDAERLAFESWMAGHCWALCAAWDGSGYRCESEQAGQFSSAAGMTRRLWAAWRDRAALAAVCAAAPNIAPTSEHSGS